MKFCTVLAHDAHDYANAFLANTQEEANAKALAWLLEETASYREEEYTDEEWIDKLFERSWMMTEATVRT